MGLPARRIEAEPTRRTRLYVVPDPPARTSRRSASSSRTRARAEEARARSIFMVFLTALVAVVLIGGVRVAFIARAPEASLSESHVRAEIRAERAERDNLEVERSSLSSPSRIAGIAETSMEMGKPKSVRYVTMDTTASHNTSTPKKVAASASPIEQVFRVVMTLSAGEAQSLLVGDLGLAGSR
jgi:cell division protein FtsL